MRLADYVMRFLVDRGIDDVFMVSGGGIMHLCDAVGHTPGLSYYCNYHEQACAIAAEGYARVRDALGACLVTTGPGAANALSGIAGAWVDSIPVVVIAGQVRRDLRADFGRIRQFGPQEGDTIALARPITKYARTITDPLTIRAELELALHAATSDRPGPVLVEIPLDIQAADVNEAALPPARVPDRAEPAPAAAVAEVIAGLTSSRRPVIVAGNGIRLARAVGLLREFLDKSRIPVVMPYTAKDLVPEDHQSNMGTFGTAGQRRANFTVQNADYLLGLGSGLCLSKTGFNYAGFAPKARKVLVDVDSGQLAAQALKPDSGINSDAALFLEELLRQWPGWAPPARWLEACARWKARYHPVTPDFRADLDHVNSYVFMDELSELLTGQDVLVTGNGLDCVSFYQAFRVKPGQRAFLNGNWGAMGWDLPAAVGACLGSGRKRTVCVTGDGSMQLNVQELLTIAHYRLPVKVFVLNNSGYASIRATQRAFFAGRFVGAHPGSGVANPDFEKLAGAYGLGYLRIGTNDEIRAAAGRALEAAGPVLCELNVSSDQAVAPKASSFRRPDGTFESRPLEDMAPFLPREEVRENMHQFDGED